MNATVLTEELYNELKQENYKYLVYKRTRETIQTGIYQPVKELPDYFVIKLKSIDDEGIIASMNSRRILIEY